MAVANKYSNLEDEHDTDIIIPKGILNSKETSVIRIPASLHKSGPLVVIKGRRVDGKTEYIVRKHVDGPKEEPEEYVMRNNSNHSELQRYFTECRPLSAPALRKSTSRCLMFNKAINQSQWLSKSPGAPNKNPSMCHLPICNSISRTITSNFFKTRPLAPEVITIQVPEFSNFDYVPYRMQRGSLPPKTFNLRLLNKPHLKRVTSQNIHNSISKPFTTSKAIFGEDMDPLRLSFPSDIRNQDISIARNGARKRSSVNIRVEFEYDDDDGGIDEHSDNILAIKEILYGPLQRTPSSRSRSRRSLLTKPTI